MNRFKHLFLSLVLQPLMDPCLNFDGVTFKLWQRKKNMMTVVKSTTYFVTSYYWFLKYLILTIVNGRYYENVQNNVHVFFYFHSHYSVIQKTHFFFLSNKCHPSIYQWYSDHPEKLFCLLLSGKDRLPLLLWHTFGTLISMVI